MLKSVDERFLERAGVWVLASVLFFVPLVYSPSLADPFAFVKRSLMLLAVLLLGGLALLAPATGDRPCLIPPTRPFAIVFFVSAAFACLLAANRGLALWGLLDLVAGFGLFLGTLRFARDGWSVSLLLRSTLIAAATVAFGSLLQILIPASAGAWLINIVLPPNRGGSTLGDPGLACQFLVLALPLGIGAAALSSSAWRQVCGGLLGLIASTLIFIGRPEGWWAAGGALLLVVLGRIIQAAGHGGRWTDLAPDLGGAGLRAFLIAGIVVLAVVSVSRLSFLYPSAKPLEPLQGTSLLSPTTGNPAADRAAAIPATFDLIRHHPLGVGPGGFRHAFLEVAWTGAPDSPFSLSHQAIHPGNAFLEMTAETGLPGGLAFALLVLVVLLQAALAAARAEAPWDNVGVACFAVVGALAGISFLGAPFQEPTPSLLFWVVAGIVQVCLRGMVAVRRPVRLLVPRERAADARRGRRLAAAAGFAWIATAAVLGVLVIDRARASMWTLDGQGAYSAGRYQAALQAFGQGPVLRSPDHLPRVLAGSASLRLGLYDRAVGEFGETLRRSPHFIAAYLGRAAAEEAQGHWDLADLDYREALKIWPTNADIYLALANLDTTRGRLDNALDDYRQVMQINPNQADTYFRMGELFLRRNQVDEAIEAFRVCAMKNPKYPRMRMRLGDAFFQKGLQEMALRYYQAAANDDAKDVQVRLRVANTLHAMDRICDAQDALEAARDLETDTARRDGILDLIRKIEPECRKQGKTSRKK
jgi:tetratricopeptide (TPR) repeat protein/O-antigen ligase